MRILLSVGLIFAASSALAVPVQWTFQDVYFDDGAALTGSFVFDVDSEVIVEQHFPPVELWQWTQAYYFDIEIQTGVPVSEPETLDNILFYQKYGDFSVDYRGDFVGYLGDGPPTGVGDPSSFQNGLTAAIVVTGGFCNSPPGSCDWGINLNFAQPLTNAGGSVALSGYEFVSYIGDFGSGYNERTIISGSVVASVIPIPAAVWLFGSALAGLGCFRRKA